MSQVGPGVASLHEAGLELVGFALNDSDTDRRADYRYLAVWKMPDKKIAQQFEDMVAGAASYEYFAQDNVRGELVSSEAALQDMTDL